MKKLILIITLFLFIQNGYSQSQDIDVTLQKILVEKNDSTRIVNLYGYLLKTQESNPILNMQILQKLLEQSKRENDLASEAIALSQIGYQYRAMGNKEKGLEYGLKGAVLAEQIGNIDLVAVIKLQLAHNYIGLGDTKKAIDLYSFAEQTSIKTKNLALQCAACMNLGGTYLEIDKLDSALIYLQKAEQLSIKNNITTFRDYIYNNLGNTYNKLGNQTLAIAYFNLAIKQSLENNNQNRLSDSYYSLADYFHNANQNDSSLLYAKKAIAVIQNSPYINRSLAPAKLLMDYYRNKNNDSAIKYSDIYRVANDSVFNIKAIQQAQLLSFDEELRQEKMEEQKIKIEEQNKQNIQYVLISIGILTLIILYLLLSRSFITNTKLIEFFGVIALLIVFEFLNLLLHPFLERVTHHNPLLMLLSLVCIAAMLVPLHHKVEKWATTKLVEKNKQIRLAAAKKTIEQLDKKPEKL